MPAWTFAARRLLLSALAGVLFVLPASAQRVPPASINDLRMSYAPIVKRVAPAVVTVQAAKTVENRNPLMEDPFFRRFFGPNFGGPRGPQQHRSLGSGVIIDASGMVVTNNHVIDGADQVKILLDDKREFDVEVVLKDPRTDLGRDAREGGPREISRTSISPIPMSCRSATWSWRSAIRSASGRR